MVNDSATEKKALNYIIDKQLIPENLRAIDFSEKPHVSLYNLFQKLLQEGHHVNEETIISHFAPEEKEQVRKFVQNLPSHEDAIEQHVKRLNDLTERRLLNKHFSEAQVKIANPVLAVDDVIAELDNKIISLPKIRSNEKKIISPEEYAEWRRNQLIERAKGHHTFLGTGLYEIDNILVDGFIPGIISIIAGPTSHGKSTVGWQCAEHIGTLTTKKEEVLWFCPESGNVSVADRADVRQTGIPIKEIKNLHAWPKNDIRWTKLKESAQAQSQWRIHRYDTRGLSATKLIAVIKSYKRLHPNLSVVFIDTIQDLSEQINWADAGDKGGSQHFAIERMMHKLEVAAQELEIHICLISQNNRKKKDDRKYRADLNRLRGSGSFEEKGQWVLFVYRPFIEEGGEVDNEIWLTLAKNRDGPRMVTFKYEFLGQLFTVGNFLGEE